MVVVDTSVWVDFFRGRSSAGTETLEGLIKDHNRVAICGIILQEILQGIKEQGSYELTSQRLHFVPYLEAGREVHLLAASLYRRLRGKGMTVPTTDALIAAVAIHHGCAILTRDSHFAFIAADSPLQLL